VKLGTLLITVLALTFSHAAHAAKMSPKLNRLLAEDGQADVLVRFSAQPDLSFASKIESREARLRFVFESLRANAEASQAKAIELLQKEGADFRSFYIENAIHVPHASKALLAKLAALSQTGEISINSRMMLPRLPSLEAMDATGDEPRAEPADSLKYIGADKVWAETGHRGEGIVVAGNDTGFAWEHPAIKRQYRGNTALGITHAFNWHDSVHAAGSSCGADSAAPCDDNTHGTHTMGTMLGDDGGENRIGVAPDAKWIGCRNMNAGTGSVATYLECFEFFLAPYPMGGSPKEGDPAQAPHIINNSWGCPPDEGCQGTEFLETVRALKAAGILVVAAVGNDGPGCGTIGMPPGGYSGEVLGVAAMNHRNGTIAGFSSRGPSSWNNGVGIDVAAPGVSIRSSVPGGGYQSMSGTSMASPHMAGVAALLWSARPELVGKIDETIALLRRTAKPTASTQNCGAFPGSGFPNAVFGSGIVDVYGAVNGKGL
jgi:serine protease AprX